MYLKYGSYSHDTAECEVQIVRSPLYNDGGQQIGYKERWSIDGFKTAASQSALTTALAALKTAYSVQDRDIGLYLDNGSLSNHFMLTALCKGGTRVTSGPDFPTGQGPEYSHFRTYRIVVEGDILVPGPYLLSFRESLTYEGNAGPRFVWIETRNTAPVRQKVSNATTIRMVQSGEAIGQFDYPPVPGPIWPSLEHQERRRITRSSPQRSGPVGRPFYTEWPISWHYEFESPAPLPANPTKWV